MLRFSDSDIGTQMIKGHIRLLRSQLPLPRGAMLHGASNRRYILIAGLSNWLFFIPQISNTELTTGSGFCPESLERVSDTRRKKEP